MSCARSDKRRKDRRMRHTILLLTLVGAVLLACSGVVLAQQSDRTTPDNERQTTTDSEGKAAEGQQKAQDAIPDQYIVVLKDDAPDPRQKAREHAQKYGLEVLYTYRYAIKGYAARLSAEKANQLRQDPDVDFLSEDRTVHALPKPPSSGLPSNPYLPTGVDRIEADDSSVDAGSVGVAIIDTGVDLDHPDLNLAKDQTGTNVVGTNCATGTSFDDGNGHGTHVAGTIGAKAGDNAGDGVVGVAPGATLYPVRVLNNNGSGTWSGVICGIDWVTGTRTDSNTTNDISVANMSLGGSASSATEGTCDATNDDALHLAICKSDKAGVTYVVAAGNSDTNLDGHVPAKYDTVLTVTALADFDGESGGTGSPTCRRDQDDTIADFSNWAVSDSDQAHTIAAPGVCIWSTWKGGGYKQISGTSMASPHVAGAAARCIATRLATGQCTGNPESIRTKLLNDAAAQPSTYGFENSPEYNDTNRQGKTIIEYYGYLVFAGS
jgi:subtilisin